MVVGGKMFQILTKVACGNLTGIPSKLPSLTSEVFTIIEIAVPVLLVIMGTIDLFKGITADKEDEMVKGRKMFIKRLITGVLVFFIIAITKMVIGFLDNDKSSVTVISCMDCFISNQCKTYKEVVKQQEETKKQNEKKQTEKEFVDIPIEKLDKESLTSNYSGVNYYLYVPKNATKGMPLVIFLHGVGEKGNVTAAKNLRPATIVTDGTLSGVEDFILLVPASPSDHHWGEEVTWTNLNKLIDYITSEYSINTKRIYLTGFSAGGMGVWGLVNKYPTKFRAAIAVSGYIDKYDVNNLKKIPIYAIVGDKEEKFVGPMQNMVNAINKAGGKVKFKKISNADHITTQNTYSTKELYQWLLSQ